MHGIFLTVPNSMRLHIGVERHLAIVGCCGIKS
jgi:hypothetical protein